MTATIIPITPAVPDPPELDAILWQGFHETVTAYDVGANCGQTIETIRGFAATVVAFEPSIEAFTYLSERYEIEDGYVLSNLAVSCVSGHVDLVAAPGKIETGQLVTAGTPGMEWSGAADGGEVRSLPCITLDDYATATNLWPGFLKIDVEGHEGRVLQGATRILETKPEMLIEIHSEALGSAIYDLLKKDYHVEQVLHPHYPRGSLLSRTHFWFRCFPLVRSSEV